MRKDFFDQYAPQFVTIPQKAAARAKLQAQHAQQIILNNQRGKQ